MYKIKKRKEKEHQLLFNKVFLFLIKLKTGVIFRQDP